MIIARAYNALILPDLVAIVCRTEAEAQALEAELRALAATPAPTPPQPPPTPAPQRPRLLTPGMERMK